jgi:hypothetical protein
MRRLIPSKYNLASDLIVALVGLGLPFASYYTGWKVRMPLCFLYIGLIGGQGLTRFVQRFRFRKALNRFLKSEGLKEDKCALLDVP